MGRGAGGELIVRELLSTRALEIEDCPVFGGSSTVYSAWSDP